MTKHWVSSWVFSLAVLGCGHGTASSTTSSAEVGSTAGAEDSAETVPATFADQVTLGAQAYGEHCASCHGAAGEGSSGAPAVVGLSTGALSLKPREGAKRTSEFVTVADVASFAVATMPPDAPGSLPAEQYWAILAFALSANGITLEQKLTPELATTLTIPR